MPKKKKTNDSSKHLEENEFTSDKQDAGNNQDIEDQNSKAAVEEKSKISINDVIKAVYTSLAPDAPENSAKTRDDIIRLFLNITIEKHDISKSYNILILHDEGRMVKNDADHIYSAATDFCHKKPLMLVLYSSGGVIDSAYLIGKLCRECAHEKFVVVVPRQAKSAATLICCAADEIHMGSLSELGPIDPQIGNLPALGLKSAVEHIADLIKDYPHGADMFAKYLHLSLNPIHLGYYERVAESAAQYAERLLKTHESKLQRESSAIARDLVYSYKDHNFVIDKAEAIDIFGGDMVHTNTKEYDLGNAIYENLMLVSRMADVMNHYFYLIGSCESTLNFRKKSTS